MERNTTRLDSQMLRSIRLCLSARDAAKASPGNVGATTRRRDRTLAAWSLSRKRLAAKAGAGLRGAAKAGAIRKACRRADAAKAAWQHNYQTGHSL